MRKVLLVLLVAILATPTGVSAEMVSNVISNSTVYQYIFINCANNDCQALFEQAVATANQVADAQPPAPTVENTADDAVVDSNLNIVENNMPIAEQTIIAVVDAIAAESGATDLPVPTEPLNNAAEASSSAVISNNESAATDSSAPAVTTAETTTTSAVNNSAAVVERKIVISEIMSAPLVGNVEWVEIENRGNGNVDLTGWTLVEGSGKKTALFGIISPGNYLMFERSSLNNSGDIVTLKDETGAVMGEVSYGDWNDGNLDDNASATKSGNSTALFGEIYKETEVPTPAQENIFQLTVVDPVTPEAVLTTSAATVLPVTVSTPTQAVTPIVTAPPAVATPTAVATLVEATESAPTFQFSDKIKISEFLPDPAGTDDGEWIELYNEGGVDVDLFGWSVDDVEGDLDHYRRFDDVEAADLLQCVLLEPSRHLDDLLVGQAAVGLADGDQSALRTGSVVQHRKGVVRQHAVAFAVADLHADHHAVEGGQGTLELQPAITASPGGVGRVVVLDHQPLVAAFLGGVEDR